MNDEDFNNFVMLIDLNNAEDIRKMKEQRKKFFKDRKK